MQQAGDAVRIGAMPKYRSTSLDAVKSDTNDIAKRVLI